MKILITGKQGFLSSIFVETLQGDHQLYTLSRSETADITADLANSIPKLPEVDLVVHNAGLAHTIPKDELQAVKFFQINVDGSQNLLRALEKLNRPPATFVYISTVAVYGLETGEEIEEQQYPQPNTPYAQSKLMAEQLISDWCGRHNISVVILRLPLIIGSKPKGNLAALLQSISQGWYVQITPNKARKSAVVGTDIAKFLPQLYGKNGIYHLTDGQHPSLHEVATAIAQQRNQKLYFKLSLSLLQHVAKIGDYLLKLNVPSPVSTNRIKKMTSHLTFSEKKARQELGWQPTPVIEWLKNNPL